jgi:hypothetical protein
MNAELLAKTKEKKVRPKDSIEDVGRSPSSKNHTHANDSTTNKEKEEEDGMSVSRF